MNIVRGCVFFNRILYPVHMYLRSLFIVGICCSALWAQQDTPRVIPQAESERSGDWAADILDTSDSWSLSKITLRDMTFYWENDGTIPNLVDDTDRYYTNGTGIELSFDPHITGDLAERLAPSSNWKDPRFGLGFAVKQMIYTGVDITDPSPATDDHPYSGYMYFAFSFQRADDQKHDHFELDVGAVGERSQAEAVQRFIHNAFPDQNTPQGWNNQLANELAINFTYERTWKTRKGNIQGLEFEMLPAMGFDLGNVYTRGRGRVTLRAGMNLPNDFGPASLLGRKDHTVSGADWGEDDWSFYVYTTMGIDVVAWNIFLDGNTFATSRSVDSETLVAQATIGLVSRYKSFYFGWSKAFETKEFGTQPDAQTWGSVTFGWSFDL